MKTTRNSHKLWITLLCLSSLVVLAACGEEDPEETPVNNSSANNANNTGTNNNPNNNSNNTTNNTPNNTTNNNPNNNPNNDPPDETTVPAECILATDYAPGAEDSWPACISDDGVYHPIDPNISTIGRVAGFESIAELLWRNGAPSGMDFIDARVIYAADQGLDSRVSRREDEHYPAATDGGGAPVACNSSPDVPAMAPERCVGPALILPILNDAFQQGAQGTDPEINAARVEAALLWFLYVSTHKEATTCAAVAKDCDSHYAYFTGGTARADAQIGLAAYMQDASPAAWNRVWDGILGVRCWRDIDNAEMATMLDVRDQAITQLDRALLYGLSRMIIDRIEAMMGHTGTAAEADWAWLQIMGGVLDRDLSARDNAAATTLADALDNDTAPDAAVLSDVVMALYGAYACP